MKKLLIIVLVILSTPSLCFATDSNQLLSYCEDKNEDARYYLSQGRCTGYIRGVADVLDGEHIICIGGITSEKMRKVVEKYLRNNPELLHHDAHILVKNALVKAFPCK